LIAFVIDPETVLLGAVCINYFAGTVTFAVLPLALVATTIKPVVDSVTVFLILAISPHILAAVLPCVDPLSVHHVLPPLALVASAIALLVLAPALDEPFPPVAFVGGSITPL